MKQINFSLCLSFRTVHAQSILQGLQRVMAMSLIGKLSWTRAMSRNWTWASISQYIRQSWTNVMQPFVEKQQERRNEIDSIGKWAPAAVALMLSMNHQARQAPLTCQLVWRRRAEGVTMLQKGPALCVKRRSSVSKEEEGEPLLDNKLHRQDSFVRIWQLWEWGSYESQVSI